MQEPERSRVLSRYPCILPQVPRRGRYPRPRHVSTSRRVPEGVKTGIAPDNELGARPISRFASWKDLQVIWNNGCPARDDPWPDGGRSTRELAAKSRK